MRLNLVCPKPSSHLTDGPGVGSTNYDVSEKYIDLWEHASTLYHGYEWQDAAHHFHCLAKLLEPSRESTLCLLNVSLIQARMGEFLEASSRLHTAAISHPDMPFTVYLLGLIEWEIGSIDKAEARFQQCLDMLGGHHVSYHPLNMRFVLEPHSIIHNLRVIRFVKSQSPRPQVPTNMSALSAELLFEAPLRVSIAQASNPRFSPQHTFETLSLMPEPLAIRTKPSKSFQRSRAGLKAVFGFRDNLQAKRSSHPGLDTEPCNPRTTQESKPEQQPSPARSESTFVMRVTRRSEASNTAPGHQCFLDPQPREPSPIPPHIPGSLALPRIAVTSKADWERMSRAHDMEGTAEDQASQAPRHGTTYNPFPSSPSFPISLWPSVFESGGNREHTLRSPNYTEQISKTKTLIRERAQRQDAKTNYIDWV
nr:hypothetical protein CFP56_11479 [Quercus suber]